MSNQAQSPATTAVPDPNTPLPLTTYNLALHTRSFIPVPQVTASGSATADRCRRAAAELMCIIREINAMGDAAVQLLTGRGWYSPDGTVLSHRHEARVDDPTWWEASVGEVRGIRDTLVYEMGRSARENIKTWVRDVKDGTPAGPSREGTEGRKSEEKSAKSEEKLAEVRRIQFGDFTG